LAELEKYKLAPFSGLSICLSGFENYQERTKLQTIVVENGGEFTRDLTEFNTHLVVHEQNVKIGPNSKLYYARKWRLQIVVVEWVYQSQSEGCELISVFVFPILILDY